MAPAIAHFLVGASLLLLAVAPLALRSAVVRRWGLWLVPVGGLWGLAPDGHHVAPAVAPAYEAEIRRVHDSAWADLFAFHYTLDQPPIDERFLASIAASILLFCGAVAVYWLLWEVGDRDRAVRSPAGRAGVVVGGTILAAGYAGGALAIVVHFTYGLRAVAALVGSERLLAAVVLLGLLSLAWGGAIAAVSALAVPPRLAGQPVAGALGGAAFGVLAWLVVVAVGVPLWLARVAGASRPIPNLDGAGLIGLVAYGAVFGLVYALVRGAVDETAAGDAAGAAA